MARTRVTHSAAAEDVGPALALAASPHGSLHLDPRGPDAMRVGARVAARITDAFAHGPGAGLAHLGSVELGTVLPPSLAFGREVAKLFFTRLCATPDLEASRSALSVTAPLEELSELVEAAPPMLGAEYLSVDALAAAWSELADAVQAEIAAFAGPVQQYLQAKSPLWNAMGRVHFHLAENKRSESAPFAFMATYATSLSKQARVQHAPLGRALEQSAGAANKAMMLALLQPVQRAAEKSDLVKELIASGELFHPVAWTPKEAHAFLLEVPLLESSGVVVRLPDWWHVKRPPRPQVRVSIGAKKPGGVGTDAMLDLSVSLALDDETITPAEWKRILAGSDNLVLLKGKWVEIDREKLQQVLEHWKRAERGTQEGVSFLAGMRLLAGVAGDGGPGDLDGTGDAAAWTRVSAGPWLDEVLADLKLPHGSRDADPGDALKGTLRGYQRDGIAWLWLLSRLGLGACLADDMGLGKTIQVLALLLVLAQKGERGPHLLVLPASLLGNWRAESARFAPSLRTLVVHPSAMTPAELAGARARIASADVVLTTYGTLLRTPWIAEERWGVAVLDEAQVQEPRELQRLREPPAARA